MTSLSASFTLNDRFTGVLNKINSGLKKATGNMQEFKDKISGPAKAFQSLGNAAAAGINKLNSSIKSKMSTASNVVKSSTEKILAIFGSFGNRVSSKLNLGDVAQKFSSTFSSLKSAVSGAMSSVVSKVSSAVSRMKTIILGSGPAFKQFGSEIKNSFDKINTSVSTVGNKLMSVAKVAAVAGTVAAIGLGKKIYDIAGGFDQQMSRVNAISDEVGISFAQLRTQAIDLGAKTAFSATEAAAGMENMASAGFNTKEIYESMNGVLALAAVSGGDVALAAENSASALRGFGLEAGQAGHVADVFAQAAAKTNAEVADMGEAMKYIAPVAHAMGISIEETAAAVGILSDSGIKGSQAGTSLRGALSRLAKPTDAMTGVMQNLGLSFYDSNGNMKSLSDQVGMLQGAFKGLTPEQQQNALVTLYGQESLSGMLALISAGPEKLGQLTKSFEKSNGAANKMAEDMQNNLPAKIEQMFGALESVAIRIGDKLFPLIGPQIEKLTDWIDKTFSEINIGSFIGKLSKYGNVLKSSFNQVKGPISDALGAIGSSLEKINGKFGSTKNVDKFKSAMQGVTDVIKGIAGFAEKHSDSIAKLISNLQKLMLAFAGFKIGSSVLGTLATFGSGLLGAAKASGTLVANLAKIGKNKPTAPKTPSIPSVPTGDTGVGTALQFQPLLDSLNGFARGASSLALVFGAVKVFEEAIRAVKQLETLPDLGTVASKLLVMGVAVASIGGATTVIGLALDKIKGAKKVLATGVVAVLAISFVMKDLSSGMKVINDNVPTDVGSVAAKMANMGIAVAAISVFAGVLGALVSSGVGALIAGAGLVTLEAIAHAMTSLGRAVGKINANVPTDVSSVGTKIKTLVEAVKTITNSGLGSAIGMLKGVLGAGQAAAANVAVGALITISSKLQELNGLGEIPDVTAKLKILDKNVAQIQNASSTFGSVKPNNTSNAVKALDDLISFTTKLPALAALHIVEVGSKLVELDQVIERVQDTTTTAGTLKTGTVSNAIKVLDDLTSFTMKLAPLAALAIVDVTVKLFELDGIIEKIQNTTTTAGTLKTGTVGNAIKVIDDLITLTTKLPGLAALSIVEVVPKLVELDGIVEKLQNTTTTAGTLKVGTISNAITVLNDLINFTTQLPTLAALGIVEVIPKLIELDSIVEKLQNTTTTAGTLNPGGIVTAIQAVDQVILLVGKTAQLSTAMANFVSPDLTALNTMLNSLAGLNGGGVLLAAAGFALLSASMNSAASGSQLLVSSLSQVQSNLATMATTVQTTGTQIVTTMTQSMAQARTAVISGTTAMASAFTAGMSLSVSAVITGNARIVGAFNGLQGQLQSAGYFAMSGLANGIAAGAGGAIAQAQAVADQVSSTIRSALKIHSPSRVMMEVGQFVGQGLANGIAATKNIVAKASSMLAMLSVPEPIGDLNSNGTITSNVQLDDSEVSRLKASASQQVIVNHKQVVPQVTIHVENNNGEAVDTEALLQEFEDRIEEMIDSDLS